MKTTYNQRLSGTSELNAIGDNYPFSHKYLRCLLLSKQNGDSGQFGVHALNGEVSIMYLIKKKAFDKDVIRWEYLIGSSHSVKNISNPIAQKHLPTGWTGENGLFSFGKILE